MHRHFAFTLPAATAALMLLAGCADVISLNDDPAPQNVEADSAASADAQSESDSETDSDQPTSKQQSKFGQMGVYSDGLAVRVDRLSTKSTMGTGGYASDEDEKTNTAVCKPGDSVQVFKLTIKNGTTHTWDGTQTQVLNAQFEDKNSNDVEAAVVWDSSRGWDGDVDLPKVRPGKSTSVKQAFCTKTIADPDDILVTADPTVFDSEEGYGEIYFSADGTLGY